MAACVIIDLVDGFAGADGLARGIVAGSLFRDVMCSLQPDEFGQDLKYTRGNHPKPADTICGSKHKMQRRIESARANQVCTPARAIAQWVEALRF